MPGDPRPDQGHEEAEEDGHALAENEMLDDDALIHDDYGAEGASTYGENDKEQESFDEYR
jgi:hypothetical protein